MRSLSLGLRLQVQTRKAIAKLYKKAEREVTFACYSEHGIVDYFILRVLPTGPAGLLRQIVDGSGARPVASVQAGQITNVTVFSELVFGSKYGIGNPIPALVWLTDPGQPICSLTPDMTA